jgi:RNA polymerase sporulation-specific sigma factor
VGLSKLPTQLSSQEETFWIKQLREGKSEAKTVLIERNLRLAALVAHKFSNTDIGYEELFSIASIGLLNAANSFNPDKNIKFDTYATRCAENEVLKVLRRDKKRINTISLNEPAGLSKSGKEIFLSDTIGVVDETVDKFEDYEMLYDAMKCLNKREIEIISARYGFKNHNIVSQINLGREMGFSKSYISRLERVALKKLRARIEMLYKPKIKIPG